MASRREKIVSAGCAIFFLSAAFVLLIAGSFIPKWTSVKNTTAEGNVSYSLWMREECFGIVCHTDHYVVRSTTERCWTPKDSQKEICKNSIKYEVRADTKCYVANYCNMTWISETEFEAVGSLLFIAKAFETPAIASALVSIVLYVIKIVLLVKKPHVKRLHLKAAYLTFGAIAGFAAVVGIVIFCVMLDKDNFNLLWAPYLNCAGGGLFIFFGVGGYLSWRNRALEDFDDDTRSEYEKEFSDHKNSHRPFLDRSISKQSQRSDAV